MPVIVPGLGTRKRQSKTPDQKFACLSSRVRARLSPACGQRGPFHGGKGPKTPRAGRTPVRLLPHRSAAHLGNRRPAPNSHVHVLQTPAPIPCGCLLCSPCLTAHCRARPAPPCEIGSAHV